MGVILDLNYSHTEDGVLHFYMDEKDIGKKKYRTVGYHGCSVIKEYRQGELFE
jgi:hypothetical protein